MSCYSKAELEVLSPRGPEDARDGMSLRAILSMGISPFYGDPPDTFLLGVLEDIYADLDDLVDKIPAEDPSRLRAGVCRLQRRARMALALIPRLEAAAESEANDGTA